MPERFYPVFQDEKELPACADLETAIKKALEQSRYLIVICSPRSATSIYVNQEVLEFKHMGRANHILALIIDGSPTHGNDSVVECFPPALRHPLGNDNNLDLSRHASPIAPDVRDTDGKEITFPNKAYHPGSEETFPPDSAEEKLRKAKLRIMAGLLGVGFDDLEERDRKRQLAEARARTRRLQKLAAGFAVLALIATVFGIFAFLEKRAAQRNLLEARQRLAQVYLQSADQAYTTHDVAREVVFLAHAHALDATAVSDSVVQDLAGRTAGALWCIQLKTPAHTLAVSHDQKRIFIGTGDGLITELETTTGKVLRQFDTHRGSVLSVSISPDGNYIATGGTDGYLQIWNTATGQLVKEWAAHKRFVTCVLFGLDGRTLYSTSDDHTAVAWNVADGSVKYRLLGHIDGVNCIAISPDGQLLATASDDHSAKLWRADDGTLVRTLTGHRDEVDRVVFTPDGSRVITSGGDGTIRVWETASGQEINSFRGDDASITALAITKDGQTVFSGGGDATIGVLDLNSGEERCRLLGSNAWINEVQSLLDGEYAVSCGQDGHVCLWALPLEQDVRDWHGPQFIVRRATFATDSKTAVTVGDDQIIRCWSVPDGKLLSQWKGHDAPITAAVYFNNNRSLLTASHDETVKIRLWQLDLSDLEANVEPEAPDTLVQEVESRTGLSLVQNGIVLSAKGPISVPTASNLNEHSRLRMLFEQLGE
ncbi:MAG TPA: TIR domain-containing protein [Candidatus Aquilonibacter sp.]|nr:TIR domain-containing protein [Candidatus Aquilonibacter sp.]